MPGYERTTTRLHNEQDDLLRQIYTVAAEQPDPHFELRGTRFSAGNNTARRGVGALVQSFCDDLLFPAEGSVTLETIRRLVSALGFSFVRQRCIARYTAK